MATHRDFGRNPGCHLFIHVIVVVVMVAFSSGRHPRYTSCQEWQKDSWMKPRGAWKKNSDNSHSLAGLREGAKEFCRKRLLREIAAKDAAKRKRLCFLFCFFFFFHCYNFGPELFPLCDASFETANTEEEWFSFCLNWVIRGRCVLPKIVNNEGPIVTG